MKRVVLIGLDPATVDFSDPPYTTGGFTTETTQSLWKRWPDCRPGAPAVPQSPTNECPPILRLKGLDFRRHDYRYSSRQ
jgi:hypothetical protein